MSRIGKKPVKLPKGVTGTVSGQTVSVKGPKGTLAFDVSDELGVTMEDGGIAIAPRHDTQSARSVWGMSRTMVSNLIEGVTKGFERRLEITGVGYRAQVQGKDLQLSLGYSHEVKYPIPSDIQIACPKPTEIVVTGASKQKVGQIAAEIREFRKPEPYKGKGVKYSDEFIFRKEGKKK
jgi:large subunit ribosomal protein L6